MGPDAGQRPEDLCVLTAIDDVELPWKPPSPASTTVAEVPRMVSGWTNNASTEEVIEAMRRKLIAIGGQLGAKSSDHMIKLLLHPSFCYDAFKREIVSHRILVDDANRQLEESFRSLRFEKEEAVDDVEEGERTMWVRDPLEVIRRQIAQLTVDAEHNGVTKVRSLYTKCFSGTGNDGERRYSHPMSTELAASVEKKVRDRVMEGCMDEEEGVVGWQEGRDFVLLLQLYSDKSHVTLKTTSQTHLPLLVAVVNTSLSMKEKMICAGDCVVGYMPTKIRWSNLERRNWETTLDDAESGTGSRLSKLRILQACLRRCLEPLLSRTVCGFDVQDSVGRAMRCHPVLWSYVTDLPEGWDISSAVWNRCSRCCVKKGDLNLTEASLPGGKFQMKKASIIAKKHDEVIQADHGNDKSKSKAVRESMWRKGVGPVVPYLLSLGNNFGVDLYKCLRYEIMHDIHHGLTKTLLDCMSLRLRSVHLRSEEFTTKKTGNHSSFRTIRTRVLKALNKSLELFDRQSPMIEFRVSHKSNESTEALNGLFRKKGLASMLEARHYAQVLQVMPFLGATCDRLCSEEGTTTGMCVDYVEMVYKMTRVKKETRSFSKADIAELRATVNKFTDDVQKLYQGFQKSDMALPKMHALLHVADDIAEGGSLAHYRADAYESSHKKMKAAYQSGSRRGDAGQMEALNKMARADFLRMASGKTERGARIRVVESLAKVPGRKRGACTRSKVKAVEKDSMQLTQPRKFYKAAEIDKVLLEDCGETVSDERAQEDEDEVPLKATTKLDDLMQDVGGADAFRWFVDEMKLGEEDAIGRSDSGRVPGYPHPVLEKSAKNDLMLVTVDRAGDGDAPQGTVRREMQRVVASHSFYGSENPVQNFVMVEADGGPEQTMKNLHATARDKYTSAASVREVWLANVLAFVKVRRKKWGGIGEPAAISVVEEKALVQYLDLCSEEPDKIDATLGCARLRWAQVRDEQDMEENMDPMRCVYGLIDVATIRGLVHVVRGDYGLEITKTYKCEGDRHWAETWFYLNRFKLERRGTTLFVEEGKDEEEEDGLQSI